MTCQTKLTKDEWNAVEIPVSADELRILKFITRAFDSPDMVENSMKSLYTHLKLEPSDALDIHLFKRYFSVPWEVPKTSIKLKKADQIRLETTATELPFSLYENVLIDLCKKQEYFHLHWILKLQIKNPNKYVVQYAMHCLELYTPDIRALTLNAVDLLEKNKYAAYKDITLYEPQKQLFQYAKMAGPKLILYVSPTGSGKTMSPLGLTQKYKVIFTCAAKHVGMALIKACISIGKPCAVAFGCKSKEDVRLHNSAAQKFTRDKKSGAIKKVDNTLGDKVEIIISDLQSEIYAEEYMLGFFSPDQLLVYCDEPTISMDEEEHELHSIIRRNWKQRKVQNIVLSSATLPAVDYSKLTPYPVYSIYGCESNKTIQVLSPDNYIVLPHQYCKTQEELMQCIAHIEENLILLKYIDLGAIIDFLKDKPIPFTTMSEITIMNIKRYYLEVLKQHTVNYAVDQSKRIQLPPTLQLSSEDAWNCSYGPTMFVVDDVKKIVSYYLKSANIPSDILTEIMKNLAYNNSIAERIGKLDKDIQDKNKDDGKEKKISDNRVSDSVKQIQQELERLHASIKPITLPDTFIPNKYDHLKRFHKLDKLPIAFTSDIDISTLEKILSIEVDTSWKVLLMMGFAVFSSDVHPKYMEIVKDLTAKEKMYAVFANKDFIFGTNYQFANLFIGKDLTSKLSQGQLIQTAGRVGRGKQVPYSIRLRDELFISKMFMPQDNIEGRVMERLYS